ncbi:rhotekin-2 isoform X3 [Manis javanica]|uniref:rhotekin-2 isoform X3 n=1 Tax=Manis javanica TaxID=9974 RepID=UPI003C6D0A1F
MQTESTPSNGRVSKTTCLKPTPGRVRSVANAFPWPRPRPQQCLKSARRSPLRGRAENPGASCEGVQRRGARPLRVRARRPSLATPLLRPDLVRPGRRLASSAAQLGADFSNLTSGGVAAALALVLALEMERPASGSAELAPAGLPAQQDCSIQEKIDLEIRMREGIWKLLSLSTQKDQILHAVKNLMVCNARIVAYTLELQKLKEQVANQTGRCDVNFESKERTACKGKIAISDIRIPLMWKDSDHFSNKERSQRYAIFCLFKMGAEVFDTDMVIVDKTITDVCFENLTIFSEAGPDFQVKVEVYSCCTEESSITNTPKKLAKKLKTSISKATGKKINSVLQEDQETCLSFSSAILGTKYNLLAHTTLTLESAEDSFKTHNLSINGNEESSFWLPLYGNMCCRLVAQPACMAEDAFAGFLNQQEMAKGLISWRRLYCVLRGGKLYCFYTPEEIEAGVEPALLVSINKETRIRAMNKDAKKRILSFSVINPVAGQAVTHIFTADNREDLQKWMEAFWQHFFDLSQWKHCCEALMKIEIMSPRKPPLFLTKEATSVYHDMSIDSPIRLESLTDIMQKKIEETNGQFLIGQHEESSPPPWATLFDGNHQLVVQKKDPTKCILPGTIY